MAENGSNAAPYDVVVIGAGIIGSSAAYHCVKAGGGKRVLLLEQFALPHSRGGSCGGHRIYVSSASKEHHRTMIKEARSLWKTLEEEANTEILREVGVLQIAPQAKLEELATQFKKDAEKSEEPFERLSEEEAVARFPQFKPKSDSILYPKAGYLQANKALKVFQGEFLKRGGILKDEEKMLEIIPGAMITVKTNKGVYQARSLILAVDAWAPKVFEQLGLSFPCMIARSHHMFWKEKTEGTYRDFPCFFHYPSNGTEAHGFPSQEYPGLMKISVKVKKITFLSDPDQRDSVPDTTDRIEKTREYVREHFPGLDADNGPAITEACIAGVTKDMDFILDVHPDHPNIAFQFSIGIGAFQFAPAFGKILGQLAFGEPTSHDLQPMSVNRFLK